VINLNKKEIIVPKHVAQYWFDFMWDKGAIQKVLIEEGSKDKEGSK